MSVTDRPESPDERTRLTSFELPASLEAITARYDVLDEVGRGGMGIVYKARDRHTRDIVAIKVLHPAIAGEPQLVERFKNELLLARKITHKNVCRVHDLNDFGGVAVISMEFVDGETLRHVLQRSEGVAIRQGLRIARQMIAGLAEAHAQGVVHRDLKPSNIQLARDGNVKVMDFGIARSVDTHDTHTGLIVGTPAYMSPEQSEGKLPDARSDIYSLGALLYELFCGQPVFTAENTTAMIAKHVNETPRPPRQLEPDLPPRIERAILRCLEKNPASRFQSMEELETALIADAPSPAAALAGDTPLHAHLSRWQRSDAALLAFAMAGAALFFVTFHRTSLAPLNRVAFDQSALRRIAQNQVERFEAPWNGEQSVHLDTNGLLYQFIARTRGAAAARALANNPLPYWIWHMTMNGGSQIHVDTRGDVTSYTRSLAPADPKAPMTDGARSQAEQMLMSVWKQQASALTIDRTTVGGQSASFVWLNSKTVSGLPERYTVSVDSRGIQSLSRSFVTPQGFDSRTIDWGNRSTMILSFVAVIFGFLQRERIADVAARWRVVFAVVAFIVGALPLLVGNGNNAVVAMAFGLLFAFVWFFASMAVESQMLRTAPARLYSLIATADRRIRSQPVGLAILRGTLSGLLLLGIDAVAVWIVTTYFGGYLGAVHLGGMGGDISTGWAVTSVMAFAGTQALGLGLLVALTASVGERLTKYSGVVVGVSALLLALTDIHYSMASVHPYYWRVAILFVEYIVLLQAFKRFDLLTVIVANFTVAFLWGVYPLFVMQREIGAAWPITASIVWGITVALAIVTTFSTILSAAYRRVAD